MIEILKGTGSIKFESNMIHIPQTVERDIMLTCSEYIKQEYESSDNGEFTGGFVEGYDIFAAGVVIICLSGKLGPTFAGVSTINKCTSLLTTIGERFAGLKVFRRVLWALSDAVSSNPNPDQIIHELPPMIPDNIQELIAETVG
ncbi:hypothetical protein N7478_006306 [Penicillium angulare]|uniref:uncharacterized protein n=1 Tax=Penicillium angulare TaxID=116970 RepID=UPI002541B606|nr:uncharacterized protein N7478_006306 [Penicillium angulare]KAJ5280934.1 hypothetical protein N7478_006306 [Penicillium angulare]